MSDHNFTLKNGLTLGYAEHGDPQGVPMFYFHGWPSARVQGGLMDAVAKKYGLRLISPDRPGIGLSDYQPNRRLADWPELMEQLAAHVGAKKFHLMGWSGGGPYVFSTVVAMPKRVLSASIVCGAPPLTAALLPFTHRLRSPHRHRPHARAACWVHRARRTCCAAAPRARRSSRR